jgi:hypothetical protein
MGLAGLQQAYSAQEQRRRQLTDTRTWLSANDSAAQGGTRIEGPVTTGGKCDSRACMRYRGEGHGVRGQGLGAYFLY